MAGFKLEGNVSGNTAEVNAAGELMVTGGSATKTNAGFGVMLCENSDGTYIGGVPYRKSPAISANNRLTVGTDTPAFDYVFNSTISNSNIWKTVFATQTITASSGFLNLNANSTVTTTTHCYYQTWRTFDIRSNFAVKVGAELQISATMPANQVFEYGLFLGVANAAPADGVFFRVTSAGIIGVMNYNGVETATSPFTFGLTVGTTSKLTFMISNNEVEYWVHNTGGSPQLLGELNIPAANGNPFSTGSLPLTFSNRNPGTVTGPAIIKIASCLVEHRDGNFEKPFPHQQAAMGKGLYVLPDGSTIPTTGAKTSLWANSTAPTAVVLTNTTAAFTGLGGIVAVLPATLAVNSDGILLSYQNPAGGLAQTPRTLYITGVYLQGAVSVILAGGPVTYTYALAYGHTAVSLATAQTASFATATTKAPVIVPLGAMDNYVVTAPVGTVGARVSMPFATPIVVNPGEFIQVIARNLGVVTTLGAITFNIGFDGYWE
jgi:hypothetical protein